MKKLHIFLIIGCLFAPLVLQSCYSHKCPAYSSYYATKVKSKKGGSTNPQGGGKPKKGNGKQKDRFKD